MAKNVTETKKKIKRIAHHTAVFDNDFLHDDNVLPGTYDFVSSIMQGMDGKVPLPGLPLHSKTKLAKTSEESTANQSTSQSQTQNVNLSRSKKINSGRKFPLMEKSQRALKQLKHNRSIPKQRAHLASFSSLPLITNIKSVTPVEKVKQSKHGNKNIKRTTESQNKISRISVPKINAHPKRASSGTSKKSTEGNINKSGKSAKVSMKRNYNVRKSSSPLDNKNDSSDSSDSEYEKFVKKSKKGLKYKKQKTSKKKKVAPKRVANKKPPSICSSDGDSDFSNEIHTSNRSKRVEVASSFNVDDESQSLPDPFDDNDTYTRDSSSDNDLTHIETFVNDKCETPCAQLEDSGCSSRAEICSMDVTTNASDTHSKIANELPTGYSENSPYLCSDSEKELLCNKNDVSNTHSEIVNDLSTISASACSDAKTDLSYANIERVKPSFENSLIVDLCDSDDDCKAVTINTSPNKEKAPELPTNDMSEESDIEIVEVVLGKLPERNTERNVTGECQTIKVEKVNVKTEKLDPAHYGNKHSAAYVTNMCTEYDEEIDSKANIMKKPQTDDDDDIMIVDSEAPNEHEFKSASSRTLSNLPTCEIKSENHTNLKKVIGKNDGLTEKELKLYEVACSNVKEQIETSHDRLVKLTSPQQQERNNLHSMDVKSVLHALKNEFSTYQEIVQAQEQFGKTFQLLESRQAEKLIKLKSMLASYTENTDNSISVQKAMDALEGSCSSKVNLGDFKSSCSQTASTSHHVPESKSLQSQVLPSNADIPSSYGLEQDIKPNLSQLQNTQKLHVSSEFNTMTFGQKCVVCGNDAVAACQKCARAFFCSNECGMKYWVGGHENECGT